MSLFLYTVEVLLIEATKLDQPATLTNYELIYGYGYDYRPHSIWESKEMIPSQEHREAFGKPSTSPTASRHQKQESCRQGGLPHL